MTPVQRESLAVDDVYRDARTVTRPRRNARDLQIIERDGARHAEARIDIAAIRRSAADRSRRKIRFHAVDKVLLEGLDLAHMCDRRQRGFTAVAAVEVEEPQAGRSAREVPHGH